MRYLMKVEAYQVLDGVQCTVWIREHDIESDEGPKMVTRRYFTATELATESPAAWARDVLVAAAERF